MQSIGRQQQLCPPAFESLTPMIQPGDAFFWLIRQEAAITTYDALDRVSRLVNLQAYSTTLRYQSTNAQIATVYPNGIRVHPWDTAAR